MIHVVMLTTMGIVNPFSSFVSWARQNAPSWVYSVLGVGWHFLAVITVLAVVDMVFRILRPEKGEP